MAAARSVTPEKQLLRLIEEAKATTGVQARALKRRSLSLFSFNAWLGRLSFFKKIFKKWLQGVRPRRPDIKSVNKILGFFIFVLAVYLISDLSGSLVNLKKTLYPEFEQKDGASFVGIQEPSFLKKAAPYYFEKMRERDIFKMSAKGPETAENPLRVPSSRIIEETKHLRLVGISWSDDPDAMVEDTKALKTFFIKRGQIVGKFKVQAIFKDKVILRYGTEEIELK